MSLSQVTVSVPRMCLPWGQCCVQHPSLRVLISCSHPRGPSMWGTLGILLWVVFVQLEFLKANCSDLIWAFFFFFALWVFQFLVPFSRNLVWIFSGYLKPIGWWKQVDLVKARFTNEIAEVLIINESFLRIVVLPQVSFLSLLKMFWGVTDIQWNIHS